MKSKTILLLVFLLFYVPLVSAQAQGFSEYHKLHLVGWTVYVEQSMVDANDYRVFIALRILRKNLLEAQQLLPKQHLKKLKDVSLWISRNNGLDVEYYFFERRVSRADVNPKMLGGIEFKNISVFINMSKTRPSLIIHELAHAYHKIHYSKIDKYIMRAYENAESNKLYKQISNIRNQKGQAKYASKNPFEYFADLSAMYYGLNDYYPYNRSELKKHDPTGYKMIEQVWE